MLKNHKFAIFITIVACIVWAAVYTHLPNQVPIHFGAEGADGYMVKWKATLFSIGLLVGTYVLVTVLPKLDPKKENIQKSQKSISIINNTILSLLFMVNMIIIMSAFGMEVTLKIPLLLVGGVFLVLGNYLQQCKPNYFIGIRTPWTLSNELVWKKTHRLGSKLFVVTGILMIISVFLPNTYQIYVIIVSVFGMIVITTVYSYVVFKKVNKK